MSMVRKSRKVGLDIYIDQWNFLELPLLSESCRSVKLLTCWTCDDVV